MFDQFRELFRAGWVLFLSVEILLGNSFVLVGFDLIHHREVLAIGLIGFMLDKLMLTLQKRVSWDKSAVLR